MDLQTAWKSRSGMPDDHVGWPSRPARKPEPPQRSLSLAVGGRRQVLCFHNGTPTLPACLRTSYLCSISVLELVMCYTPEAWTTRSKWFLSLLLWCWSIMFSALSSNRRWMSYFISIAFDRVACEARSSSITTRRSSPTGSSGKHAFLASDGRERIPEDQPSDRCPSSTNRTILTALYVTLSSSRGPEWCFRARHRRSARRMALAWRLGLCEGSGGLWTTLLGEPMVGAIVNCIEDWDIRGCHNGRRGQAVGSL